MRNPFLLLTLLTLITVPVLHAEAQETVLPPEEPVPAGTEIAQQETPDPFLLTATAIIRQATWTATARGTSGAQPSITPSPFVQTTLTGTPVTPVSIFTAQSEDEAAEDDDPLILTFLAFGTLLLVLVVFGYVVITASNAPERRNR